MKLYIKSSEDNSEKYVIVRIQNDRNWHDEDNGKPLLFIDSRFERYYQGYDKGYKKVYSPNFTSTRANNLHRAKKFNSKEEAEAFIDKQAKEKDLWRYTSVQVMPLSEAMELIGNPDDNYKAYKQAQSDRRKAESKKYAERNKEKNKQNKEYNPGTYRVRFWYAHSWLGEETYTVDADSVDDAFKKAKAKALQQDPYRATQGYDERMIFNKNEITKIK